jgi:hypothetical protein
MPLHPDFRDLLAVFAAHDVDYLVVGGAPVVMLEQLESALDEDVLWMGVPPVRLDVVKGVPGGDFPACLSRRVRTSWDGVSVSVISKDDLIAIKRASGRPQDLLDVEALSEPGGEER